ncbi:MAG TPA: hypothetical protein VLK58_19420 [Conexibacter sp.]|nr:hypothetical protein [Conexibacter sp.]
MTRAQAAAARFGDDVARLNAATVDRQLIRGLRQGASTLQELVVECDQETIPTTVVTTPETTTPPETTPTTPPDTGGGTTTPPDTGGGTTPPEGGGDSGDGGTADPSQPDVNQGNPGGALAPGQGGTP